MNSTTLGTTTLCLEKHPWGVIVGADLGNDETASIKPLEYAGIGPLQSRLMAARQRHADLCRAWQQRGRRRTGRALARCTAQARAGLASNFIQPPSSFVPVSAPQILVIDDHAIVRLGVRQLLGERALLHEAADIPAALALLAVQPVALALLDLNLGDQFSLSALPRLREARPGLKVIVLTSMDESLHAERALRAGADGYVMKSELGDTLAQAIEQVLAGDIYVSPAQRSQLLRRLAQPTTGNRAELSPREVEVLRLVAAGKSTREIAETLNRSVKTIETHKQTLKTKLGAETPAMLVRRALAWFGEEA